MIKIEHLVKNYGSNCAVDDISFEVGEGEIVGFLGPNGAGKSTTMNILTGYLSSTSGKAFIGGIDILSNPIGAKKLIGYLPEQPPLYLDMTVEEYLNFNYELKGCKLDREKHIGEICDTVKIKDVYKRIIRSLSKGYRQRVGIAQALIGNHTPLVVHNYNLFIFPGAPPPPRRFNAKICGPQKDVLAMLRAFPGITYAEALAERDGDAYTYMIESDYGVDIRKKLFFELANRGWALIGLEALGMSLEDIFISVVDHSEDLRQRGGAQRVSRKQKAMEKNTAEKEIGASLVEDAKKQRAEAALHDTEDDD